MLLDFVPGGSSEIALPPLKHKSGYALVKRGPFNVHGSQTLLWVSGSQTF